MYGLETQDRYDDEIMWYDNKEYDADPESEAEIEDVKK